MRLMFVKFFAWLLLAAGLGFGWALLEYNTYKTTPLNLSETIRYEIKSGKTLKSVANDLKQLEILSKPHFFYLFSRLQGNANRIQVGEYEITPGTTPPLLLHKFISGKVIQYSFTIVEGWNIRELMEALNADKNLVHHLQKSKPKEIMQKIGYPDVHPEGRFLPDTYFFPKGNTDIELLQRAYVAMEVQLEKAWQQRTDSLPLKTPYDALILASIVEKETAVPDERPLIAGVFIRRLQKKMRLQTDPTVIYGIGESFDGNIRRRDLKKDTPYNTYLHKGLTPTPIAMPGKDAIFAALHPNAGQDLYFVAKGDGSHEFSDTLTKHNNAVIKFQLKGKARSFSSYRKNNMDKK